MQCRTAKEMRLTVTIHTMRIRVPSKRSRPACASIQAQAGGFAPDRGVDRRGLPAQHGERFLGDPLLGGWVAFGEEGPGGGPDVFEDVNEIAADVHLDLAGFRLGLDAVDLVFRAVDHGDPGALVVGVSALRLAEYL